MPARTGEKLCRTAHAVEETLAGIWAEVLGVERIGIHDNFFELGGHSLLATQVISQVRRVFQVDLPLRRLFESPTVAGLAEHVQVRVADGSPPATAGPGTVTRERQSSALLCAAAAVVSGP